MKIMKNLFVIIIVSVFMISVVVATAYAVNSPVEKTVEIKEKKVGSKVTWNANGGKIASKKIKTSYINKGAKVKLPTTPKRIGYDFKGWYTKKNGGKKITRNTKASKSVTYYAHWKRVLTAEEKKLVGRYVYGTPWTIFWQNMGSYGQLKDSDNTSYVNGLEFKSDGTFKWVYFSSGSSYTRGGTYIYATGDWRIPVKGTARLSNHVENRYYKDGTKNLNQKIRDYNYRYAFEGSYGIKWTTSKYSMTFLKN